MKNGESGFSDIVFTDAKSSDLTLINCGFRLNTFNHIHTKSGNNIVLSYVEKGSTVYYVNQKRFNLSKGMLYLVAPWNENYYDATGQDWSVRWIGIGGQTGAELVEALGLDAEHPTLQLKNGDTVCELLKRIFEVSQAEGYNRKIKLQILMYSFFEELFKSKKTDIEKNGPTDYIEAVDRMIEYNFSEGINVSDIAEALHLNRSYLSRLYKEKTGMSISERLAEKRMLRAKDMLINGETVAKTATECGFFDPLYFSRAYKKRFGVAPTSVQNAEKQKANRHI